MIALLQYLPILGLVILANVGEKKLAARQLTYLAFVLFDLALLAGGAAFVFLYFLASQPGLNTTDNPLGVYLNMLPADYLQVALAFAVTAILGLVVLIPGVRRLIARVTPLGADSCMDCAALSLAVYFVGMTWAGIALLGGVSGLGNLGLSMTPAELVGSGLMLVVFAIFGVGIWLRRKPAELPQRLGLGGIGRRHLLVAAGMVVAFLALDVAVAAIWSKLDPAGYELVSKASGGLFGGLNTPVKALVLALATGIGEELLFRGAIQPRFGLLLTSLVFAFGHLQYAISPALLQVFLLSLGLGYVRIKYNTTTCMIIHGAYNLIGLLFLP